MKKIFVYAFALALMVSCGGSGSKSTATGGGNSSSNTEQNEHDSEGMDDEEGGLDMLLKVAKEAKSIVDSDDEDEFEEAGVTMKAAGALYKGAGKMMQEHGDEDDKQKGKVLESAGDAFSAFGDIW
jgi:hypothetical protein